MAKELKDLLDEMHRKLAENLLDVLEDGEKVINNDGEVVAISARPATLNVIRQFLKDNDVSGIIEPDGPENNLAKKLRGMDLGDLDPLPN